MWANTASTETSGRTSSHSPHFPEFRILCTVRGVLTVASDIDVLARFGRALADPIRCRILLALVQRASGRCSVIHRAASRPEAAVRTAAATTVAFRPSQSASTPATSAPAA